MNKTSLIVVAVVLIGAGAWYMMSSNDTGTEVTDSSVESTSEAETGTVAGKRSMRDLMAMDTPQMCTFNHETEAAASAGTVYTANGKMRGDFNSATDAGNVESHMIMDGGHMYMWSSAMPQGMKMAVDQNARAGTGAGASQGQMVDYNQALDYNCQPWSADASMFIRPGGVEFMDMSAMMKGIQMPMPQ